MAKGRDGSMRDSMPEIAAWIDDLRRVFGRAEIDDQIRRGLRGECVFWASENGRELGVRGPAGVPLTDELRHAREAKRASGRG